MEKAGQGYLNEADFNIAFRVVEALEFRIS